MMPVTRPWEETWTPRHSRHASEHLPRIVNEQGDEVLLVPEHTSASYERATLDLAAAAPELYRALAAMMGSYDGECLCKGRIIPSGPCPHEMARSALRKARGES